jgi:DNA-binding transcriptional MerR regulator
LREAAVAEIPDKPFYKIGEVCQYTDTQPYVLRFWESEFPRLAPQKSRSGQRMYTRRDIDLVLRIKQLLYEEEFTIAGARKKLEQEETGESGGAEAPERERRVVEAPPPLPFEEVPPRSEPIPALETPPQPAAPSPAERARAVIAETEIGALRKRIADLESRQAALAAALEAAEQARRGERERRERAAARLEALLHSLESPPTGEPADRGELDDRPGIS